MSTKPEIKQVLTAFEVDLTPKQIKQMESELWSQQIRSDGLISMLAQPRILSAQRAGRKPFLRVVVYGPQFTKKLFRIFRESRKFASVK